ncbi:MAG TPA: OsmC family protein [Vicinamibacteria bacterium]|nr:OsmC family protein [Vicinamibacteria bacterium]
MTGTLGRALEVRGIPSYPDKLSSTVEGDIEDLDGIMRITKVRIHYRIKIPAGKKEEANRALSVHERGCPAAMTVKGCVDIKWTAELEDD